MAEWEMAFTGKLSMPFMPSDGYVSRQNPPDFTWGLVDGAEAYELEVSIDEKFENIAYKVKAPYNFHNFDRIFKTGIKYWWRVRYIKDGKPSDFSAPRRFRIDPRAYEFPVPDIDTLMKRVPRTHPRICTTPEELSAFRAFKDKNADSRVIYESYIRSAKELVAKGIIDPEPTFEPNEDWVVHSRLKMELFAKSEAIVGKAFNCAFAYLLSGDKSFAEFGIKILLSISRWDIHGATSYKNQDQVHRSIAYRCSMAYDWLYDAMTDGERAEVLTMIRERTLIMSGLIPHLKKMPYDSHGWTAFGYIGIIALSTFGEIPESEEWLRQIIQQYTVILPPWSYQDGGWSQGTGYWQYSTGFAKEFTDILAAAGVLNLYGKTWQRNEHLWSLYAFPCGMYGSFGDGSIGNISASYNKDTLYRDAYYMQSSTAKALASKYGPINKVYYNYRAAATDNLPATMPSGLQLSHAFRDIGWVTMSDQLENADRILLTFKSSPYGSFNHSHADQNSFVLHAYGARLAINSGYYDAYHSKHDSGFTRKTHAHNSVTITGKGGQQDDNMFANGHLTSYLTHPELDLAGGDATAAYVGKLKEYQRNIIYLRPDIFVVVDDLAASGGERETFEWWLNADSIELSSDKKRATVSVPEQASLSATLVYPKVTGTHIGNFSGSDGVDIPPQLSPGYKVHQRVYFKTEAVEQTKMIAVLDVGRANAVARDFEVLEAQDYVKISFADGKCVYVNKNEGEVEADSFKFAGKAIAVTENSVILVEGTVLSKDGVSIFEFESTASAVVGMNELVISTFTDNRVKVGFGTRFVETITSITDFDGSELVPAIGVNSLELTENSLNLSLDADCYELMCNGKSICSDVLEGKLTLSVDGIEKAVSMPGKNLRNCKQIYTLSQNLTLGKYKVVSKNDELSLGFNIDKRICTNCIKAESSIAENRLEIRSVELLSAPSDSAVDCDALKDKLDVFIEAEDFFGKRPLAASVYSNRPFLSGGKGVKGLDNLGDKLSYKVNIPENGEYDFVVKYVAWNAGGAERVVEIDGESYKFALTQTDSWGATPEQWRACRVGLSRKMTKGEHFVVLEAYTGEWNYDWLGFIKKKGE